MTSAMDHHIEDQEDKMRILFENDKEDLRENGISLEKETELLIIEDLPSPIAMEITDFNCRSDETTSPNPDKSDKSLTDTSRGTSEDLTIPSSPLTEDCVSPLMEDSVFPPLEDSLPITSSPLDKEELKPVSDQVGEVDSTCSNKEGECYKPHSEEDSEGSELNGVSSSHSESDKVVEESLNSKESSEIIKGEDDKSRVIKTDIKEDSDSSCETKSITEDVTAVLPPITEEVTSNIPPVTEEVTSNIPSVMENNTSNLQPATEEVTSNLPRITEEVTANFPPITEEVTANFPPITEEVTANFPPITDVGSNLPPITEEATANSSPTTEEVTSKPVNDIRSPEGNLPEETSDDALSETKDEERVKTNVIVTEDPVDKDLVAISSSVQTDDSNDKKVIKRPSKLTVDSVHVDSDSIGSADLPLTPGSQGSCDPPLTPSSIATDFNSHEEVQSLQRELVQTHTLVKQLQAVILKERVTHSHNVAVLKMRLQQKEEECRKNAARSDKQLGEVIAHLLLLEGQLKKEHTQVRCKMADNENIIRKQEEHIESLTETNQTLLDTVREAYGRKGKNGVMLLDNLGDDKNGSSESLESPTSKSPPSVKSPHKGKWGSMKDKMTRKHRSSLDLSDTDFEVNRGLLVGRQYGSQESLLMIGRKSKEMREGRDKKCRSIAGYPDSSLVGLMEVPDENEIRLDSFSHSKVFGENKNQRGNGQTSNMLQVSFNGIDQSSAGLLSAISMPILSQTDKNSNTALTKERPKSISSIEHISSRDSGGTPDLPPQMESYPPPPKSPGATSNSSFSESSNPFKNLKTILKRKGSKIKGKKRSVTMADAPSQDYQAAVKKHFEKYDMS
ncbi:Ras GTPase-activating protein nGAP [Mizuhopecten yessoensis]|uniref:Ras GTPase-activating protein nGAP n=1 Tax=Mizuhopecten yessoensis TaxID=6573 RepID=A0A210QCS3_MIZYE|nr:Ras GTPase-activating protein nGAP [Mizuhopecten yessoensis]